MSDTITIGIDHGYAANIMWWAADGSRSRRTKR